MVKGPAPFDQGIFLMHLGKGKEYFDKGEFQKAREELEAAYHLRPQDEKVLNMLGMTYFKMELLPQAEEMYVALSTNNPDVYTLQSNLGLIRLKLGKVDQAETALTRALELQPANPKAHFYLGLLYEKTENWEKALLHFEAAKADKMVLKAREKLAEQKARVAGPVVADHVVRAFQILEVLPEESTETQIAPEELPPLPIEAPHIPEKEVVSAESEWVEGPFSTGKMRRKDVLEAMKRLEEKEAEEVEELVEDAEVPAVEEEAAAEPVVEEKPWEKTQPTLKPAEPEPHAPITQEIRMPAAPPAAATVLGADLFIQEETAADISTFLAQSREEDATQIEPPDFIQEPPVAAAFQVIAADQELRSKTAPIPVLAPEPAAEHARIPSPDEIENATHDFGAEAIFSKVEEPAGAGRPARVDEAAELFADQEEEEVEEESVDARTLLVAEEAPASEADQLFEAEPAPTPEPRAPLPVAAEPEPVEHTIPMKGGEERQPEPAVPTVAAQKEAAMVEAFQPANLDQFSRDRFYIQPLIGADRFLLIDPHLLEIIISDRMIVRKGTISSYTGRVSFTPWADQGMPLVEVSGSGIIFLADRRKEIFIISLNNESIFVESNHLLVAQSVLKVEPFSLQHGDDVFSTVKISGRGTIAITCQTKPLTLNVYEAMPANIPADALIAWSGKLVTEVMSDQALQAVMMQPDESGAILRFSGSGDVVVEQGSLWGDRRMKK